jgi:hypothetical protein
MAHRKNLRSRTEEQAAECKANIAAAARFGYNAAMNDQPPPLQPTTTPPPVPRSGSGGCVRGCVIGLIAFIVLVVAGLGCAWWMYGKAVGEFTADQTASIAMEQPTPATLQQARTRLQQLQDAVRNGKETVIEFSAADLNSLIATDPSFATLRGRIKVYIPGDDMNVDVSAPLDTIPLPKFRGRWFNGKAQFRFNYDGTDFFFNARSIDANGHRIDGSGNSAFYTSFLRGLSSSFSRSFNESFHKGQQATPVARQFWSRVRSMTIRNGKLVVETRSGD